MKLFNLFLLTLLAPTSFAFARYEVHNRAEKVNTPFTITLPYPASWKIDVGYEDRAPFKNAIFLQYPQPAISFDQEICALPSKPGEWGIKSCTFTACIRGAATITFSLPYKTENAEIPDNVVITYHIDGLE